MPSPRLPPGQRAVEHLPVLHFDGIPRVDISKWSLRIFGLVRHELRLSYSEFTALPRVTATLDAHCVTGWSKLGLTWEGVSTREIKRLAHPLPEARYVMVHSADGYTTSMLLADFLAEGALLAVKLNGKPLSPEYGSPVRLVVPGLYFWKSAKWVVGVEFMAENRPGFWEARGYHMRGNVWREERRSDREL
ncbi:MAG: sulfite oxidase-like oxidoreductase [Euryarchaeota archaeon]|nr:sulfite oxidase-like oxidoreductase [Euryarchaeota archaeon]